MKAPWRRPIPPEGFDHLIPGTLMEALGIRILGVEGDTLSGTLPVDRRTRQPFGLLHGGASVALAETLGSLAAWLAAPEGCVPVGLEINASHLRAVCEGVVTGHARPVRLGSRHQVWAVEIEDDHGRAVCVCRLTVALHAQKA
ncbi:MAG: hotdog fold thioesterase [Ectothiorhodospira sp.]